jgi:hypothetical protein
MDHYQNHKTDTDGIEFIGEWMLFWLTIFNTQFPLVHNSMKICHLCMYVKLVFQSGYRTVSSPMITSCVHTPTVNPGLLLIILLFQEYTKSTIIHYWPLRVTFSLRMSSRFIQLLHSFLLMDSISLCGHTTKCASIHSLNHKAFEICHILTVWLTYSILLLCNIPF